MLYPFSALLARMKYITRWSLMHSTRAESLSEHTCDTALLAHTLCLIARRYTGTPCRPKTVAVAALYHDAPEIITGDMPTPVKYHSEEIRKAYGEVEDMAVEHLVSMLPPELREAIGRHFPLAEVLEPGESWLEREEVPEHLRQAAEQGRWQYVEEYLSLLALWERGGIVLAPEALPQLRLKSRRMEPCRGTMWCGRCWIPTGRTTFTTGPFCPWRSGCGISSSPALAFR